MYVLCVYDWSCVCLYLSACELEGDTLLACVYAVYTCSFTTAHVCVCVFLRVCVCVCVCQKETAGWVWRGAVSSLIGPIWGEDWESARHEYIKHNITRSY